MMTPERAEKKKIKAALKEWGIASLTNPVEDAQGYYHMGVPVGMGTSTLDFVGCYRGYFFAIEAKGPDGAMTAREKLIARMIDEGGGLVVTGTAAKVIAAMKSWMEIIP